MKGVDDCLCDNFDTPGALGHLRDIVKAANVYIGERYARFESRGLAVEARSMV